ncbi:MAG: hypothetical protein DRJ50_08500, partial [Actinobacteria bacterium]
PSKWVEPEQTSVIDANASFAADPDAEPALDPIESEAPTVDFSAQVAIPTLDGASKAPDLHDQLDVDPIEFEAPTVDFSAQVEISTLDGASKAPDFQVDVPVVDHAVVEIAAEELLDDDFIDGA